jgi:hypothetical protein
MLAQKQTRGRRHGWLPLFRDRPARRAFLHRRLAVESLESRALLAAATSGVSQFYPRIINGTPTSTSTSAFESVGMIGDRSGHFCSGTLIAPQYALTAAHCAVGVANTSGRFSVDGTTYSTSQVIVHPAYNPSQFGTDRANDLAIYKLSQPVTGITPSPIFRGTPQVGDLLTLVGFGAGGSGTTGELGDFGTKRFGTTPIDRVSATLIGWSFDNNTESNTAPGDSGGPAFLNVGGTYYVAGITSGGSREDAALGDQSFDTRVDPYAAWIDSIITPSTPSNPPTPATVSIVATTPSAAETKSGETPSVGVFTVSRTGATDAPLTVSYTISGSAANGVDYTWIASSVVIPTGSATATITIAATDDTLVEATEKVKLTLSTRSGYSVNWTRSTATVQIADNDVRPVNDAFAKRLVVAAGTVTGTNVSASRETREPNPAGVSGGKSVWWSWKAPAAGAVSISTAGSSFDTALGVYTGSNVRILRTIATNDDADYENGVSTSQVTFTAVKGTTYQILVDGYHGAEGDITLNIVPAVAKTARSTSLTIPEQAVTSSANPAANILRAVDAFFADLTHAATSTVSFRRRMF